MQEQLQLSENAISARLWRAHKELYSSPAEYEKQVIEQYKIAVEMADRVSARRMLANSFFVGVHTAIIAAIAFLVKENYLKFSLPSLALLVAVIMLCLLWWRIITSYKMLNSGKFKIIAMIEERLPVSIYGAEWLLLGEGKDKRLYNPITHIEEWVPWAFVAIYLCLGGLAVAHGDGGPQGNPGGDLKPALAVQRPL